MPDIALAERPPAQKQSLIVRIAERFGVEPGKFYATLRNVFTSPDVEVTEDAMLRLAVVMEQYNLNPITNELYAFMNKAGKIVPYVPIDGWLKVLNTREELDGFDIDESEDSCTVTIYRKDRAHPTKITEWLKYCKRNTAPWGSNPPRMLRHKAMMQCIRYAFGLSGIYDEDEARDIIKGGDVERVERPSASAARVRSALAGPAPSAEVEVIESGTNVSAAEAGPATDDAVIERQSLQQYVDEVLLASTIEDAALVVDEARSSLDSSQLAELNTAYRARWVKEE